MESICKTDKTEINNLAYGVASDEFKFYKSEELFPAEERTFLKALKKYSSPRILDLGVGAGRTTSFLLPRAGEYIGIDYSLEMIKMTKLRFPDANIRHMDARNVGRQFAYERFDIIVFSLNGIDYMDHESRLEFLSSVRTLITSGVFIFSSHNYAYGLKNRGFRVPAISISVNPLRTLVRMARTVAWAAKCYPNHLKMSRFEETHDEWGYFNDKAHNYGLIAYYISPSEQLKQLQSAGLGDQVEIYSPYEASPGSLFDNDVLPWLLYACWLE